MGINGWKKRKRQFWCKSVKRTTRPHTPQRAKERAKHARKKMRMGRANDEMIREESKHIQQKGER